jgi:hypothetical protein
MKSATPLPMEFAGTIQYCPLIGFSLTAGLLLTQKDQITAVEIGAFRIISADARDPIPQRPKGGLI